MRPISVNPSKNTIFAVCQQGLSDWEEGRKRREGGRRKNEKEGKKKINAYLHTFCFQLPKGIFLSLWSQRYRILGTNKGPDK